MNEKMSYRRYSLFLIFLVLVQMSEGFGTDLTVCTTDRTTETYKSKISFYRDTGPGTMALLPNATKKEDAAIEHTYIVFSESGTYHVSRRASKTRGVWWLVINHRGRQDSERTDDPTYLGVLVVKLLRQPPEQPLELVRTGSWYRPGVTIPTPLERQFFTPLDQFMSLQDDSARIEEFDRVIDKWHAIPRGVDKPFSWEERRLWHFEVDKVASDLKSKVDPEGQDSDKYRSYLFLQGRLLRFQMTRMTNPQYPVTSSINIADTEAIFIKTFSPVTSDFRRQYCIILTD